MVKVYFKATNDTSLLKRAFPLLLKEYDFWRVESTITLKHSESRKRYHLNRYVVKNSLPRPESYLQDYTVVETKKFNDTQKKELYADIASCAETGWDFSSRWVRDPYIPAIVTKNVPSNNEMLRTLNTRNVVPVDLNSILYMNEITLSEFAKELGDKRVEKTMKNQAKRRREAMMLFMWDEGKKLYMDFNLTSGTKSEIFTLASYFPFW